MTKVRPVYLKRNRPFYGSHSRTSDVLHTADKMRQKLLDEASLLKGLENPLSDELRAIAEKLSLASLERIAQ